MTDPHHPAPPTPQRPSTTDAPLPTPSIKTQSSVSGVRDSRFGVTDHREPTTENRPVTDHREPTTENCPVTGKAEEAEEPSWVWREEEVRPQDALACGVLCWKEELLEGIGVLHKLEEKNRGVQEALMGLMQVVLAKYGPGGGAESGAACGRE